MQTQTTITPANTQFPTIRAELLDRLSGFANKLDGAAPVTLRTPLPEKRAAA